MNQENLNLFAAGFEERGAMIERLEQRVGKLKRANAKLLNILIDLLDEVPKDSGDKATNRTVRKAQELCAKYRMREQSQQKVRVDGAQSQS